MKNNPSRFQGIEITFVPHPLPKAVFQKPQPYQKKSPQNKFDAWTQEIESSYEVLSKSSPLFS